MRKSVLACAALCGLATPSIAADLSLAPYPPPLRPLYSWTGCYIGVNIGGGAARKVFTDTNGTFAPPGTDLGDHTAHGAIGGGQLGCDYQLGPVVFGAQGLLDLSGIKGSNTQPTGLWNNSFIQTVSTVTARVGYTVTPTLLLYGKGGWALAHDLMNVSTPPGLTVFFVPGTMNVAPSPAGALPTLPGAIIALGSATRNGWTAGFGLEYAFFGQDIRAFLEYNYMGFGTKDITYLSAIVPNKVFRLTNEQNVSAILFGINYRFVAGGALF
jgi:outer membrane immunogenic protein